MATHALGQGTCNLPINFKSEEKEYLGRLAFESKARSVGAYVRYLILRGLESESPAAAQRLRAIRALTLTALLAGASVYQWFGFPGDSSVARRSSSAFGVRLTIRGNRQELETVTL